MDNMSDHVRPERVAVRLTAEENRVVLEVANELGLTASDVMRMALRKAHADRFKRKRPTKKR